VAVSQNSVEIVRAAFEEIGRLMTVSTLDPERSLRDDYARIAELLDPDFELVPATSAVERRTLHGLDGFATFMEGGRDTWRDVSLDAEEFVDLDDQVLAIGTFRASGRASGAKIEQPNATVWTLRGARVLRVQVFLDRGEALAAVGAATGS
jgi:ketosteroid isomerase-like protein